MIRIERIEKPEELTDEVKKELTLQYKRTEDSVWNKSYIKKALLEMSHHKCAYCEMKLGEEGKYMQVEHFHCKKLYPDEVVDWDNLLPSCNRCNSNQGRHDTVAEPIIDPCIDNPAEYLYIENYRIKSRHQNELGKQTIEVLYLNESESLVLPRFKLGNTLLEKIGDLDELLKEYIDGTASSTRRKNRVVNGIKELLEQTKPEKEYSATVATVIMGDGTYQSMKNLMKQNSLWNEELEKLDKGAYEISLLKDKAVL